MTSFLFCSSLESPVPSFHLSCLIPEDSESRLLLLSVCYGGMSLQRNAASLARGVTVDGQNEATGGRGLDKRRESHVSICRTPSPWCIPFTMWPLKSNDLKSMPTKLVIWAQPTLTYTKIRTWCIEDTPLNQNVCNWVKPIVHIQLPHCPTPKHAPNILHAHFNIAS